MANAKLIQLVGSQIHGFHTMEDLDIGNMMEDAKGRWLRPNEIHAILSNHKHFTIFVKPVNLPKSGTIILFDRKMLRNFRKDGHNWKKKNDRKTVKEAHEHLKVGNEERIHVYYAHGEDNSTFVRRCYWLLDKSLEHIVLVHYRETQEMQGSPKTPGNSNSTSAYSDPSPPWVLSEENDSVVDQSYYNGNGAKPHLGANDTIHSHKMTLHEINTLEWDELVVPDDHNNLIASEEGGEPLKTADSFERWMNYIISDSPGEIYDTVTTPDSSISTEQESYGDPTIDHHQTSSPQQIFSITDVSPAWAPSNEETKVLVVGFFHKDHQHVMNSNLFCVCGDVSVPAEIIQTGVFRCLVTPHNPGLVNLYLSFDGHNPISLPVAFEYRSPTPSSQMNSATDKSNGKEFQVQMRLAHLLFSTSKSLNILSSKVSPKRLREAKVFTRKTSHIIGSWEYLIKSIGDSTIPSPQEKDSLFELTLQNRLLEWLMERVIDGSKISDHDDQGQGVIHLCAILGYIWAIYPFSWSGLSLDYRDKFGWTALHWAAFYGREKMVATLLSAGAKPNLVTDPTSEYPGGRTAADLASKNGYDGLAAYLSEKGLVSHFKDMTVAGNVSGSLRCTSTSAEESIVGPSDPHVSQEDLYMKDTLTAYRTAADAAARIQAAFRDQSYKLQKKEVQASNTEDEARSIIAAMKIQHAFRNHKTKKKMAAAARLQYRFRTWKLRKEFLNMRRQAIKIQAIIRGIRARRQYRKIIWSVGVVEKAILRWRLKRKGLRGLNVNPDESTESCKQENEAEEDFFYASRKQAEERIERSVVRVQAMFRSKKAQEEYQIMKQAHYEAMLEYEGLNNPAIDMNMEK